MVKNLPSAVECARLYLTPPMHAFWRWSKDQSAIESVSDGSTIMLREELAMLFKHRLAAQLGMPSLQAIVVLSAMLRSDATMLEAARRSGCDAEQRDGDGVESLPKLADVRDRIRNHPSARALLYDWVLHASPSNRCDFCERVASAMAAGLPDGLLQKPERVGPSFRDVLGWIRFGCRGLTPERLELLSRTGVSSLPDPEAIDLTLQEAAKSLLNALTDDQRLGGFARSATQAMAALRVPSLLRSRDHQAQGGVAGLTNRGSLDRLAVSELAHDDHVLAVRIATNEALYIEREVARAPPDCHRQILLDCGVRMWGTPRVLAVAAALALCVNADRAIALSVDAVVGGAAEPVDLGSRTGLIEQLERIDWDLDLRGFLPGFLRMLGPSDEPVVVVHRETAEDPSFRSVLAGKVARMFVVDLAETGEARMWEVQPRGWRQVGEATLSTDGLMRRAITDGPSYFRIKPAPIVASKANAPDITAVAWSHTMGFRTRRGGIFVAELTRKGHATLRKASGEFEEAPLLPHPEEHQPRLTSAQIGQSHVAFWDGTVLHFVPRNTGEYEFSLSLSMQAILVGYCSQHGGVSGKRLIERLAEIAGYAQ